MDIKLPDMQAKCEAGDYERDGLLYCGKCNTKKQTRVTIFGAAYVVPCLCACAEEKKEQEKAARREHERLMAIDRARHDAFQDGRMIHWTFADDDGANLKLSTIARRYAKNFDYFRSNGRGLLMYGNTGTGKTFAACCIANKLIDDGYSVLVKNFSTIANEMLSTWSKEGYMAQLNSVSLLVLDDLDIERQSEYMQETVYNVIDGRYRAGKPVIVTTNLTAEQLKNPGSVEKLRVYSRLIEMCIPVPVSGEDRRYKRAPASLAADMAVLNGDIK